MRALQLFLRRKLSNLESKMKSDLVKKSPRKVLVFVPEFPRLTETFIQREISGLIDLGNLEVSVFSLRKTKDELFPNVAPHVVYQRLKFPTLLVAGFYFLFKFPGRLWRTFIFFLSTKEKSAPQKLFQFIKSVGYAYLFSQHTPDFIYANFMSWPSTVAMISSKLLEIPYAISAHAKDILTEGEFIKEKVDTAKFITICNRYAYEVCLAKSGRKNPTNVFLQYHGIDSAKTFESIESAPRGKRLFIFNGGTRLVEKKGQKYLIEAVKILKDKNIDFELHIAGPGPLYNELVNQVKELGLEENVFIHGEGNGLPFNEVASLLKACDIVVQSNINSDSGDADGIPTFVIESALLGKPIVATDAGSIPELIVDGETGWIVPQKDPQALAEAIIKVSLVIKDPLSHDNFGQNVQKKALEMFDLDTNIRKIERLLLQ